MSTQRQSWANLLEEVNEARDPVPPGRYVAEIVDARHSVLTTGNDSWHVKFVIMDGVHVDRVVRTQFVIAPANHHALRIFFSHMDALGLPRPFFAGLPDGQRGRDTLTTALLGARAMITVSQREYPRGSGNWRNEVDAVKAPPCWT